MKLIAIAVCLALLSGCATVPKEAQPNYSLVDPKGLDWARYSVDYRECAALAQQANVADSAAANGAAGAAVGAAFGALIGAVVCGRSCAGYGAAYGAGAGGGRGAVAGANAAAMDQQMTLRNCLVGRGYTVIR